MTTVTELDTPAVTINLDRLEANIRRVQGMVAGHGIGNRPHVKTHKIPAIAKMQIDAGAIGITCQKVDEAEVFVDAGVADDILLSYNIVGETEDRQADGALVAGEAAGGGRRQRDGGEGPLGGRRPTFARRAAAHRVRYRTSGGTACSRRKRRSASPAMR